MAAWTVVVLLLALARAQSTAVAMPQDEERLHG
jgi:hypothetical protein